MLTGKDFDHHCHSNLVRAIEPFGLVEAGALRSSRCEW